MDGLILKGVRMEWIKAWFVALFLLSAQVNATPLLIRTGAVNKPFQVIAWATIGYNQTSRSYNWMDEKFGKPEGFEPLGTVSADLLASLGLPGKLELGGVLPLAMKSQGDNSAAGIGDALLVVRYGILQFPLLPIRAGLSLGVSLPTGDKDAQPALGDGTTDIGLALAANTIKLAVVVAHLRGAYWFNGKSDSLTKLGNMVEYMAGLDFPVLPKLTPQIAVSGYSQGPTVFDRVALPFSEVSRGFFGLLLMWQPIPKLVLRPKVSVPIQPLCKGGAIADCYPGLDVWMTLP
ncbi:MAG: hypothetical protein ACUVUR_00580 [bacterium]